MVRGSCAHDAARQSIPSLPEAMPRCACSNVGARIRPSSRARAARRWSRLVTTCATSAAGTCLTSTSLPSQRRHQLVRRIGPHRDRGSGLCVSDGDELHDPRLAEAVVLPRARWRKLDDSAGPRGTLSGAATVGQGRQRTMRTGSSAFCTSPADTEPRSVDARAPRPRRPATIRAAPSERAEAASARQVPACA